MTLLSIDPGSNVGWALFDDRGDEIARGVYPFVKFIHSIHYKPTRYPNRVIFTARDSEADGEHLVDKVVYESWYQDPGTPQGGSQGPAQEVIGILKYLSAQAGIEPAAQRSAILPVAMKHWGYEPPVTRSGNKKHLPDQDSAWLHGKYRLTALGVIQPLMP